MEKRQIKVPVQVENLDNFQQLLQKATDQVEQLKVTLKEIHEFKAVTNLN